MQSNQKERRGIRSDTMSVDGGYWDNRASYGHFSRLKQKLPSLNDYKRLPTKYDAACVPPAQRMTRPSRKHRERPKTLHPIPLVRSQSTGESVMSNEAIRAHVCKSTTAHKKLTEQNLYDARLKEARLAKSMDDKEEHDLKKWLVQSRHLLETLMAMKKAIEVFEIQRARSLNEVAKQYSVRSLELKLVGLKNLETNIRGKCHRILTQIQILHNETSEQLKLIGSPNRNQCARRKISDAEVVVHDLCGRKLYFRGVHGKAVECTATYSHEHTEQSMEEIDERDDFISSYMGRQKLSNKIRVKFTSTRPAKLHVCSIEMKSCLFGIDNLEASDGIIVSIYEPQTSTFAQIHIERTQLLLISPRVATWNKLAKIHRTGAGSGNDHLGIKQIAKCLSWTRSSDKTSLRLHFPVIYRSSKIFTYRSYTSLYGFLSVRPIDDGYSLKIIFHDIRTRISMKLELSRSWIEKQNVNYASTMAEPADRQKFIKDLTSKLYAEYTTLGFELCYPSMKPKGKPAQHPKEKSVMERHQKVLTDERQRLELVRKTCVQEAASLGIRRVEKAYEYYRLQQLQMQEQKRQQELCLRKNAAIIRIQSVLRGWLAAKRFRAVLAKRAHDLRGNHFQYACQINGTHLLLSIRFNHGNGNVSIAACHPTANASARLDIPKHQISQPLTNASRRAICDNLVHHHLDVFRSDENNILVLGFIDPFKKLQLS